jgi:hypothetical protein
MMARFMRRHDYSSCLYVAYSTNQTQDPLPLVSMVVPNHFYRMRVVYIPIQPANTEPIMQCLLSGTVKRRIVALEM